MLTLLFAVLSLNASANDPWALFKKPAEAELKKTLSAEQYQVTQREGTETPFHNDYWHNDKEGIYVDVVSGEPLFSSVDKFDSGTGWPSFTKPLESSNIVTKTDRTIFSERTEVRSKYGDSHLGHVFQDGPPPTGLRYCMNSASLRFIAADQLKGTAYEKYLPLFQKRRKTAALAPTTSTVATLAGGCFWGMEEVFRKIPGVVSTRVGYTGGEKKSPSYEDVSSGKTGHAESIEIRYDPHKTSYREILLTYFRAHDPTSLNRQGNDVGTQYRSAIFVHDDEQKKVAEEVKSVVEKSGLWKKPIETQIVSAQTFYPAEDYHQKYLVKNPHGYNDHFLRDMNFDAPKK